MAASTARAELTGPPLRHPDDPRWGYYAKEGRKLLPVVQLGMLDKPPVF